MTVGTLAIWSHDITSQEQEIELRHKSPKLIQSDLLPPVSESLYHQKLPRPFQTEPPAGDQLFRYMSLWGTFHI